MLRIILLDASADSKSRQTKWETAAHAAFGEESVGGTEHRTGILVYLSFSKTEWRSWLIGLGVIPEGQLEAIGGPLMPLIRIPWATFQMCSAVFRLGALCKAHHPMSEPRTTIQYASGEAGSLILPKRMWWVICISALMMSLDAEARVGGGGGLAVEVAEAVVAWHQTALGSSSSSFLLRGGCWNYSAVGIPLTSAIVFALYWYSHSRQQRKSQEQVQHWYDAGSAVCLHECTHRCRSTLLRTPFLILLPGYSRLRQGLPQDNVEQL